MTAALSWAEGSSLVNELGSEGWLAKRIETERKKRGWSQAELSRRMSAADAPLHQSAISKIESPPSEGKRSIAIGEAIGFAKVFDIPLGELLLPPETVTLVAAMKALAEGPILLRTSLSATGAYEAHLALLAGWIKNDPAIHEIWFEQRLTATKRVNDEGRDPSDSFVLNFYDDLAAALSALKAERVSE